jgi:hypothetical protein
MLDKRHRSLIAPAISMDISDHVPPAITVAARAGYAARGVVYLMIGGLTTLAAFGTGERPSGSSSALQSLLGQPMGDVLLILMALGLAGYAFWRAIQATLDTDSHGTDAKGIAIRGGLVVSSVTHIMLAVFAVSLVFTLGGSGSSSSGSEGFTAWLLNQAFGVWLVAAVGVAVIGAGVAHAIKGIRAHFERYMDLPANIRGWAQPLCRFGLVIRGLVLIMIGIFFCVAAYQADPSEAGGLGKTFSALQQQPFGSYLLAFVAVGLFAFGAYSVLESLYRRVDPPSLTGALAAW